MNTTYLLLLYVIIYSVKYLLGYWYPRNNKIQSPSHGHWTVVYLSNLIAAESSSSRITVMFRIAWHKAITVLHTEYMIHQSSWRLIYDRPVQRAVYPSQITELLFLAHSSIIQHSSFIINPFALSQGRYVRPRIRQLGLTVHGDNGDKEGRKQSFVFFRRRSKKTLEKRVLIVC